MLKVVELILLLLLIIIICINSYNNNHRIHYNKIFTSSINKIYNNNNNNYYYYKSKSLNLYAKKKVKRSIEDEENSIDSKIIENNNNNYNDITIVNNEVEITSTVRFKEEISSPFRLIRKFIYGGTGMAGAIGTITAIPQLIFALQDGSDKINDAITNVAIDIGAVIGSIVLFIQDNKAEKEKLERFAMKEKGTFQMSKDQMKDREKEFSLLPVEIIFSEENENITRIVSLADLQGNGKQNVICIGGSQSYIKDCLISARIEGPDLFSSKNTYIIPVVIGDEQLQSKTTGFGTKEEFMTAPYIGKPTQINVWQNYLLKEVQLAEMQGSNNVLKQGIVLAVKQNGIIIRRGLGLPPFKTLVEEMTSITKKEK